MKAWCVQRHAAPRSALVLEHKQLPDPGPGEIRLRVDAAALGLPDVLMCRGNYEFKPELPFTPGQEFAGTVLAVGEGSSAIVGEQVLGVSSFFNGQGSLAQECMSLDGMIYPIPEGMSDTDAAAFGIGYQTAWIGLVERAAIQADDTLLVLGGAGGSGSAAIQLGSALGARVIAVAGGEQRCAACLALGASEAIDHHSEDFVAQTLQLTADVGADIVFDPVGGEVFERASGCLANGGRLLAVGFAAGRWGNADTHTLVVRNATVMGVYAGAYNPQQRLGFHQSLTELYQRAAIRPVVGEIVAFPDVPVALEALAASRIAGKIVTRPHA